MSSDLTTSRHLGRKAVVYIRQSSPHQVINNQESLRLQYALSQRAHDLGWHEADIDVIDADPGMSGAAATHRRGFKELVARVTLGEVGLILSIEVTRLARNCSDWYPLLDVCGHRGCLIADRDGIYDPGTPNGRLLLGLKGTISELELHTIRGRLTASLLAKDKRGELAQPLLAGFAGDPSGIVTKDPDQEVQDRISLVFESFLSLRTAAQVTRALCVRNLSLPRRDPHGEVYWKRPSVPAVTDMLKNPAYAGAFVYGRKQLRPTSQAEGRPQKTPRPMSEWRIVVKDKYPAYVSWETFEKVRAILRDNRSDYLRVKGRGVPRDGAALLHGITWCGDTRWSCATKAAASRSATICANSTILRSANACGPRRSTVRSQPHSSKRSPRPKSKRFRKHARCAIAPPKRFAMPGNSRFSACAIRRLLPSASSIGSTRTTGLSPRSWSDAGRRLCWN